MATKVYVVKIEETAPHTNADKLELYRVLGWWVVGGKGVFQVGDLVAYFEVDSVLPDALVDKLFANSKIKPSKGRIRAVKIRGAFSQGLLMPLSNVDAVGAKEGDDLTDRLGVKKYEPPEDISELTTSARPKRKKKRGCVNTEIPRYIDTTRFEKAGLDLFDPNQMVHVTAKIHGTSVRCGWSRLVGVTWWAKAWLWLLTLLRRNRPTFIAGSRNNDFASNQLYMTVALDYELDKKLAEGEVLFGEIVGPGIQKNYSYGYPNANRKYGFYAYALMRDGKYVDYDAFCLFCQEKQVPRVPLLYIGPFHKMPSLESLWSGRTPMEKDIPCREGVVIGSVVEQSHPRTGTRMLVKSINPEYLLNPDNTDNH